MSPLTEPPDDEIDPIIALLDSVLEGPCREPFETDIDAEWRSTIDELLSTHNIEHVQQPMSPRDSYGEWNDEGGTIFTPALGSELAYLVALHEIGHIVLRLPSHDPSPDAPEAVRLFTNEAAVWEWAIEHAPTAPSSDAELKILALLFSDDPGLGLSEARTRVRESCAARRQSDSG